MKEKLSDEGVSRKTKTTNEVSLIKAHFVRKGRASLIITTTNPNPNKGGKLESTPNSPIIFFL